MSTNTLVLDGKADVIRRGRSPVAACRSGGGSHCGLVVLCKGCSLFLLWQRVIFLMSAANLQLH